MKTVIQVILFAAICFLGWIVFRSVDKPLEFTKEQKARYEATQERLKAIRTAEVAYKSENKKYTASFDSLINFLKVGSFKVIKQIGDEDDSTDIKLGRILRDTVVVSVKDSLFKKINLDSLRYVPYTHGAEFELGTANLEAGKVMVNVFEAKVSNDILLDGLDPQLLLNFNIEREKKTGFAGLKVGSLTETTNNAGNWED